IINELSQLLGSGVHPDAVLKKLKDSNEKWYALEDMEKLEGDKYPARNRDLWNKFRAVSKELFEPTQAFFEKRSEQQSLESDAVTNLIQKIQDCDLDSTPQKDLANISTQAINHLKSLDKLPPKQRGKLAKKIRAGINRIDEKLKEFYSQAENNKLKLIEQAISLAEETDLESAISQAKGLQSQWKDAGIVRQYTERKLWKSFRKANDAVFNRRDLLKKQQNDEKQQQLKQAGELLKKFETNLKPTQTADDIQTLLAQFNTDWRELHVYQKELINRQNKATKKAYELIKNQKNRQVLDFFNQLEQLDSVCIDFENSKTDQEQALNKLDEFETKLEKNILTAYKDRVSKNQTPNENAIESMNKHLIKCEYLTGNETPKAHHQDRMAYQVKILSERLSGEKLPDERQQAIDLLNGWYVLTKPDQGFLKKNSKRISKNIKSLMKLL
ncbi:MAG: DUF349 domain-containing protein, partial [Proteobacteria bacterium]|nr:DUF349 domain-containing protein [Pseudomonadota bacterium]